ncbi:MAG: hypothetical protein A2Y40_09280 [Candidatus Margulisbacteria bacterium GWF2_35_9]|nr:MAG: hypothetical protein A2Y40_09280 [Candidatus Margulisbacteria bacterium GWF2_35_9]
MKITIGITTYNRKKLLEKTALSISKIKNISTCNIRIYDDHSLEFDEKYLRNVFPTAKSIKVSETNLGPDGNTANMYRDFLSSGDDLLVNMDADLLCRPDIIGFIKKYIKQTDGVLGLYNSFKHTSYKKVMIDNDHFVLKKDIGAAGVVFTKEILKSIIEHVDVTRKFDWDWSDYLVKNKKKIIVSKESYIQHIGGIEGANCGGFKFDFALNFVPLNETNSVILREYLSDMKRNLEKKRFLKWVRYQQKLMGDKPDTFFELYLKRSK